MVLGEIHCFTNLLLDNSNVHVSYFIFHLETLKVMVRTYFHSKCYFSQVNSLIYVFLEFLYLFMDSNLENSTYSGK